MVGTLLICLLTALIGAFFGSVSGISGIISGAVSGFIVAWFFVKKMYSIRDSEPDYYKTGMAYGILAGLISGTITHVPYVIFKGAGVIKESTFLNGFGLILLGAGFGLFVGFVFSFFASSLVRKLH